MLRDMVHEIDYAGVLFGRPDLVGGRLETSGPLDIEAEQAATLLWTTRDRFTVTARLDYVTRPTIARESSSTARTASSSGTSRARWFVTRPPTAR